MKTNMNKNKQVYPKVVNRNFLMNIADRIYNPKTKKFLRLCDGALVNGPDPKDYTRKMHCGIGEIYYETFGEQPAGIDTDDAIQAIFEASTAFSVLDPVIEQIKKLNLGCPDDVIERLENEFNLTHNQFKFVLNEIPGKNDDDCGNVCTDYTFKLRARRVAHVIRKAARLLPE